MMRQNRAQPSYLAAIGRLYEIGQLALLRAFVILGPSPGASDVGAALVLAVVSIAPPEVRRSRGGWRKS